MKRIAGTGSCNEYIFPRAALPTQITIAESFPCPALTISYSLTRGQNTYHHDSNHPVSHRSNHHHHRNHHLAWRATCKIQGLVLSISIEKTFDNIYGNQLLTENVIPSIHWCFNTPKRWLSHYRRTSPSRLRHLMPIPTRSKPRPGANWDANEVIQSCMLALSSIYERDNLLTIQLSEALKLRARLSSDSMLVS